MVFSGTTVLLIGDSHTAGGYGQNLMKWLESQGARVSVVAHIGAKARDYVGSGKYASEIDAQPTADVVIITLGTNDAAVYGTKQSRTADAIEQLKAKGRAAVYVGPPAFSSTTAAKYTPNLSESAAAVWAAVSPLFSVAIDPSSATAGFTRADDVHFGPRGYAEWASYVAGVLDQIGADVAEIVAQDEELPAVKTRRTWKYLPWVVAVLLPASWWLWYRRK